MDKTSNTLSILILGSGEIARYLASIADALGHAITICANDVGEHRWPRRITQRLHNFQDRPWSLTSNTHAVIAQGHKGDAKSLAALLNHRAEHVYLIASKKRAHEVVQSARPLIKNSDSLDKRLSSPAGLNLGGQSSSEIALSVLAEIQWRHYGQSDILPLTNSANAQEYDISPELTSVACPGKRP